jgi:thioredoxin-dependent peroxiredoxin
MSNKKFLLIVFLVVIGMFAYVVAKGGTAPPAKSQFSSLEDMIGKPAPDFTLKDQKGQDFKLSSMHGKKVVLFFNEGIMCYPACWNQIASLGSDEKLNTPLVITASVVTDGPSIWDSAFKKMPELNKGTILFDTDASVSNSYGMMSLPSSMHKGSKPGHTYVIVDPRGIVRYVKDDPDMGIRDNELDSQINKI